MNTKKYIENLRFVAHVVSYGIERLPLYDVTPKVVRKISPYICSEYVKNQRFSSVPSIKQGGYDSQQGLKQTCGHSHKSTRVKYAEKN